MKITRRQLRQIIQEAVVAHRTRGQNDRKGFSSGIYEEDETKDESESDSKVTLQEIRSLILEEIDEFKFGDVLDDLLKYEFEGKPGDWTYKIKDSEENRDLLKFFDTESVDGIADLVVYVYSGRGKGFEFKLGDIKGDWLSHPLTDQISRAIKGEYSGIDGGIIASVGEFPFEATASLENNNSDNYVSPGDLAKGPYAPSVDTGGGDMLVSIAYFDIAAISEYWNQTDGTQVSGNLIVEAPRVEVQDEDVVVITIPSTFPEAYYIGGELMRMLGAGAGGVSGVVGVEHASSEYESDIIIKLFVENEDGGTLGAEIKNYRQPPGIHRHAFEVIIYRTPTGVTT